MTPAEDDDKIARRMQALLETQDLGAIHIGLYYGDELLVGITESLPTVTSRGVRRIFRFDFPKWSQQLQNRRWEVRISSMDGIELASLDVTKGKHRKGNRVSVRVTSDMKVELWPSPK